jgi:CheY-like chemotaxis protein
MLILLVDDEEAIVNILRSLLKEKGHDVLSARNGQEALGRLNQVKFDLVISDIYMPVMDGIKFHDAMRAMPENAKLPFLFISGYDDKYTAGAVRDPRYDGFWEKGKSVDLLMSWVDYFALPEKKRPPRRPDGVLVPPFVDEHPENVQPKPDRKGGETPSR